jgi:hypothetical protein
MYDAHTHYKTYHVEEYVYNQDDYFFTFHTHIN